MKKLLILFFLLGVATLGFAQTRPDHLDIKNAPAYDLRLTGAKPSDGVDDAASLTWAINNKKHVTMCLGEWTISSPVVIATGTKFILTGEGDGTVVNTSGLAGVAFTGYSIGGIVGEFQHFDDGHVTFLQFDGSSGATAGTKSQDILIKKIRSYGSYNGIDLNFAQRVTVDSCIIDGVVNKCVQVRNKCVMVHLVNSGFFGNGLYPAGSAGLYAAVDVTPATGENSEGIFATNCTFDYSETGIRISDTYSSQFSNCYVASYGGSYSLWCDLGTSGSCHFMQFTGCTFAYAPVYFSNYTPHDFNTTFTGSVFESVGAGKECIVLGNGVSGLNLNATVAHAMLLGGIFYSGGVNNARIYFDGLFTDANITHGVLTSGANFSGGITNFVFDGVASGSTAALKYYFPPDAKITLDGRTQNQPFYGIASGGDNLINGQYAVGQSIASITTGFNRDTHGEIVFTGYAKTDGFLKIVLPAGLTSAKGTGWDSIYIYKGVNGTWKLPFWATEAGSGTIGLAPEASVATITQGLFYLQFD